MTSFRFRHPAITGGVVLLGLLACLYSVSLGHNFLFDEESIILENPLIRDVKRIPEIFRHGYFYHEDVSEGTWTQYYRPLTTVTFALDHHLWKLNPLGYNLTNLAFFMALCMLFWRLAARMTRHEGAAFFATLLFSVHTIHTEAVTYIASRSDLLGSLFFVAGLLLYWDGRRVWALVLYAFALFTKESMLLLPLYFGLLELAFLRSGPRKAAARLAPFAAAAVAFYLYRRYLCPVPMGPPALDVRAAALRALTMGRPLMDYFQAALFPEAFKYCDGIDFAKSFRDPRILETLAVFAALLSGWALTVRRRGAAFFGMTLFGLSLGPYLQIIHFYPNWAEHYFMTPLMGLTIALAAGFAALARSKNRVAIAAVALACAAFFAQFVFRTAQRNAAYNDTIRYYELLAASDTPYAYYGVTNLGRIAVKHGDWKLGGAYFRAALAMENDSESNWNNMGAYWLHRKDFPKAYECFKKAYEMGVKDGSSLQNAALALIYMKRYGDARLAYEAVMKKKPADLGVYTNLMLACELAGDAPAALRWGTRGTAKVRGAERAILLTTVMNTAYRHGWDSTARRALRDLAENHAGVPWLGETALFLTGALSAEEYRRAAREKYPDFVDQAESYVLMGHVLAGDRERAAEFLADGAPDLRNQEGKDPKIVRLELARAESLVKK